MMKNLTWKTFTTKDAKGCEFECSAFYHSEYYDGEKFVRDTDYYGMNCHAKSLQELKKMVANKK